MHVDSTYTYHVGIQIVLIIIVSTNRSHCPCLYNKRSGNFRIIPCVQLYHEFFYKYTYIFFLYPIYTKFITFYMFLIFNIVLV